MNVSRRAAALGLGASLLVRCSAARAQASKRPIIGFVSAVGPREGHIESFRQGISEQGRRGEDVQIEERYAEGDLTRMKAQIADLIAMGTRIFVTAGDNAMLLVQAQDPSAAVVVAAAGNYGNLTMGGSISRPGGNVTGFAVLSADLAAKRMQLLRDIVPGMQTISVLLNPASPSAFPLEAYRNGANALGLVTRVVSVMPEVDLVTAFQGEREAGSQGVLCYRNFLFESRQADIIAALSASRLPSCFEESFFVKSGALLSYSPSLPDLFRRSAAHVVKILDGVRPADIPIELPTRFEIAINLKTARALQLEVPTSILFRADDVIE